MRKLISLKECLLALGVLVFSVIPVSTWAHGGASGVDLDACRIPVGPHWVHFTAYQPQLTGTTEYCNSIPELGSATLVFDYEGKALRNMTVEFEVTKEPQGTRLFYKEPSNYPTGTVNTTINFTEPGDYLAHVTLVNEGQKVDAHVPFSVGTASGALSTSTYLVIAVILIAVGYILYLSNASFKGAVDRMMKKSS
ncbi:uncharacterized protein sS8_1491 [Methylocaldum marinum]|uniref:Uncharacterized protein n=1 Tax=Methylocaldum marinum TaxID=1432792 RepID=A0A250KR47_9GAMM|nr:hypothetical protein [Methylocaldum marinum]BBA33451.1 uncharacterized protein sS8_1491 [Methylocaldum marinum]